MQIMNYVVIVADLFSADKPSDGICYRLAPKTRLFVFSGTVGCGFLDSPFKNATNEDTDHPMHTYTLIIVFVHHSLVTRIIPTLHGLRSW